MRDILTIARGAAVAFLTLAQAFAGNATAGDWSLPDSALGQRVAPSLLLSRGDVQQDLGLNKQQVESAAAMIRDLRAKVAALHGKADAAASAARRAIDEAQGAWFEKNLTPDQRSRLYQLDLQWEGPLALQSRETVAERLELTTVQRSAVESAAKQHTQRSRTTGDPIGDQNKLAAEVLATLTPEQRERWRALLGRPFKVLVADRANATARK